MQDKKGLSDRAEALLAKIPGIRTYRDREHRRETDKNLRVFLASQLQEIKSVIQGISVEFSRQGQLDPLADLDRLSARIQQMADTIRYASYGFGGIFDLEKIREEKLERLYTFDLSLLDDISEIRGRVETIRGQASLEALRKGGQEADQLLSGLEKKFRERSSFLAKPD